MIVAAKISVVVSLRITLAPALIAAYIIVLLILGCIFLRTWSIWDFNSTKISRPGPGVEGEADGLVPGALHHAGDRRRAGR